MRKSGKKQGGQRRGRRWSKSKRLTAALCGAAALLLILAMMVPALFSALFGANESGDGKDDNPGIESTAEGLPDSDSNVADNEHSQSSGAGVSTNNGAGAAWSTAETPAERVPSTATVTNDGASVNVSTGPEEVDKMAYTYGNAKNDNVRVLLAGLMGYDPDRVVFGYSIWGQNGRLPRYPVYKLSEEGKYDNSLFAYTWGGKDGKVYIDLDTEDEKVLVYNEQANALEILCTDVEKIWATDRSFSGMYIVTLKDGVADLIIPETRETYRVAAGVSCVLNGGFNKEGISTLFIYSFDTTTEKERRIAEISVTAPMDESYIPVQGCGDYRDTIREFVDTAMQAETKPVDVCTTSGATPARYGDFRDTIGELLDAISSQG